ncbi:hypothetical protein CNMCM6069_006657 [Aspergillus lentulus]|nr:hypothetical protein CNMCM6069_006657 [Aspergillus lentulus]KAF4180756.1 hypothetical protein CNMCM8060_000858 [Aspergillus lentulus]KAF4189041.1 hypothetical protein CNMCM7927_009711 [Aspergillus lentulus]KAF4194290.1 hypothetical protein CNMCM8694_007781 [Aspergillus lentulus]
MRMSDSSFFNISASEAEAIDPQQRLLLETVYESWSGQGIVSAALKRLSDAVADGDPIKCVFRATCVNQDGRTPGLAMPSGKAQLELIRSAYQMVNLDPSLRAEDRCQYFEAYGTGTPAGNPEDASAIYQAFFRDMPSQRHAETEKLFGGTNAHAIFEGYEEGINAVDKPVELALKSPIPVVLPFVFSASSASTFWNSTFNISRTVPISTCWSWRRHYYSDTSFLTHRIAVLSDTIDLQITGIREEPDLLKANSIAKAHSGCRWVCTLLLTAQRPRSGWTKRGDHSLSRCDQAFPLKKSRLASQTHPRLHEAVLSQPLCTALQIILVNVLSALVAYLRGHVARLAGEGAMLAAGISREEAIALCQQPGLDGKIS